jgi:molybdenum cofactor cytidylyltransferase
MLNVVILILAAGSSSRMKTPKQLLTYNNTTLLGHTIENATASEALKTYCVLGSNFEDIKDSIKDYNIKTIFNSEHKKGLSTSIVEGIKQIQFEDFDAALVLLADQPKIDTYYINLLIETFNTNPKNIIASNYSDSYGVPAIFPKSVFRQLLKLKGDKGAKEFLNSGNIKIKALNNSNLTDIDTPKDYKAFLNSTLSCL